MAFRPPQPEALDVFERETTLREKRGPSSTGGCEGCRLRRSVEQFAIQPM